MKRRTISLLALALAAVMALGLPVSAEEILENPSGEHLTHVALWDTLIENNGSVQKNFGTVQNNNGAVNNNNGTVTNNYGIVENNFSGATVTNNYGTVKKTWAR